MLLAIYPNKSQSEDQPLEFNGDSHKTQNKNRQEVMTTLKKHSLKNKLEAYIEGGFKRRQDKCRYQNSGRVLS